MSEIGGSGSINPRAQKLYQQEYQHGAALFEKALTQANKSSYAPQKEQFNDVMNMAMEVLNQTARGLKNAELIKQNQKIAEDFQAYQKDPSKEHLVTLKHDLDQAKKSFGSQK